MIEISGFSGNNIDANIELDLRVLAKENRFSRRVLSQTFFDFHNDPKIAARIVESLNGIIYVFLKTPISVERRYRQTELWARCYIAKSKMPNKHIFVGLAIENYIKDGHSLDMVYLDFDKWTEEDSRIAEKMIRELNLFSVPYFSRLQADEYPT